ncbi:MAG TPA: S41 family peptidase [Pyrinomonadaceae bacterium]|nr:S41 family peptidase [Pyrinomonadaceae bacterium]
MSTATREGRLAIFDDVWSTINDRYYDRSFHGINWDAQRTNFRAVAADAATAREFYAVLRQMIGALNDPHTRIFAPEEKFDWWRPRFASIGLSLREISGLPTVIKVEPRSAPERAGVRAGDVIESVNGLPAPLLIKNKLTRLPAAAGASTRHRVYAKMLDGPPETSVEIVWSGKNGKQKTARFVRSWQQRDLGIRIRREKQMAIVEMDAFTKPIAADFTRALREKLEGIRGVVIDLRGNGGGDAEAMADVATALLGPRVNLGEFIDRGGSSFVISTSLKSPFMADRIVQTSLPVVVLASERTSSAAEILLASLKNAKRATIVGTETCGCVLAIRTRHTLPDGGLLDVSELDYQTSTGERLEGNGVKPDEHVTIERNDLYAGRDRSLEIALRFLSKRQN